MWQRGGSLHPAFHGFTNLLWLWHVDIIFMSELNVPVHPTLPNDQPYQFVGLPGSSGRDAGFLIANSISLECIPGISDTANLVWRLLPATGGSTPIAMASFWAPHVGLPENVRMQFWIRLHTSISVIKRQLPGISFLIAGDANLWIPGLVTGRDARPQDSGPINQRRVRS